MKSFLFSIWQINKRLFLPTRAHNFLLTVIFFSPSIVALPPVVKNVPTLWHGDHFISAGFSFQEADQRHARAHNICQYFGYDMAERYSIKTIDPGAKVKVIDLIKQQSLKSSRASFMLYPRVHNSTKYSLEYYFDLLDCIQIHNRSTGNVETRMTSPSHKNSKSR